MGRPADGRRSRGRHLAGLLHSILVQLRCSSRATPPRRATRPSVHPADEVGRVTQAIERLSDRIDTAESRQALAIAGVERSVREVIARIDAAEREQMQVAARFEGEVQEVKAETARLATACAGWRKRPSGPRSAER